MPTNWVKLDSNPATNAIAAGDDNLYQLHADGKIFRFNGTPLTGWDLLDSNPATQAIVAAGDLLYQLHADGKIFRFDGTPLTGLDLLTADPHELQPIVAARGFALSTPRRREDLPV